MEGVLGQYELAPWTVVRDLGGGNSLNLLLRTTGGPKVLKGYRWSMASIEYEHSILALLTRLGFPAPALNANVSGETCTLFAGRNYSVYDYHRGYNLRQYVIPPRQRRRMVRLAGSTLGHFHQAVEGLCPEGHKVIGMDRSEDRLFRGAAWQSAVVDKFLEEDRAEGRVDELFGFICRISDRLRSHIETADQYFTPHDADLPRSVIHGDYAPHNLVFKTSREVCLLDLGDANYNLRALDLARGLATFTRGRERSPKPDLVEAFLAGYREYVIPYESELASVSGLLQWRFLRDIVWRLHTLSGGHAGAHGVQESAERRVAPFDALWESIQWLQDTTAYRFGVR